jgi:CO/xanthine dehydrogenase Mo-binding subunit
MSSSTEKKYEVIGTRPVRPDGVDKVTGSAVFGADVELPRLLFGKFLRSPHAHARIESMDTRKAEALEGVKAVVTAADLPDPGERKTQMGEMGQVPLKYLSRQVLAADKVLYHGHAVAAVAATTPYVAEEALQLIDVKYEVLPAVLGGLEAMKGESVLVHDDLYTEELGKRSSKPSNVASHQRFEKGDLERGFAEADHILERTYRGATVHQGYIEPQVATAWWKSDGHLTIWCPTQGAFNVRDSVHQILGIPVSHLTVVPTEVGGAFGGKIIAYCEPVAALLSKKAGRPVKTVLSREEVFLATGPAPAFSIQIKMGVTEEGRIVAVQAVLAYDAGAFPGSAVTAGGVCLLAPYKVDNFLIDMYDVVVNKPKTSAYRAPGAPNAVFATECLIDEFSEILRMDPLEFRLLNAAGEGDRQAHGPPHGRIGYRETVEAALKSEHYQSSLKGANQGRGVACGHWMNGGGTSSVLARLNPDGTVNLAEGSPDLTGTRTSIAMQLAEVLGIPASNVALSVPDTDSIGITTVSGGSRVTFATGWAAYEAGQSMLRQLTERAAQWWDVGATQVVFEKGVFSVPGTSQAATLTDLAEKLAQENVDVSARVTVTPKGVGSAFATHIADVEVDPETGKVTVLRYTAVQDVGRAIHPGYVEGQIQGGVAQGIGWALHEEYVYDDSGRLSNPTFLDYRIPTACDLPFIETVIVEVPNPGHPFGARGAGEVPIVPPLATISNAIYRAVGVRLRQLPMSPPRILEALMSKE